MRGLCAIAVAGLATACAAQPDRNADRDPRLVERALAGRVAGPAERCLPAGRSLGSQIVGRTILYRDGRTIWRTDLPDCPSLAGDPIIVTEPFASSLCENDRIRTLPRGGGGIVGPSCRIAGFVPYRAQR